MYDSAISVATRQRRWPPAFRVQDSLSRANASWVSHAQRRREGGGERRVEPDGLFHLPSQPRLRRLVGGVSSPACRPLHIGDVEDIEAPLARVYIHAAVSVMCCILCCRLSCLIDRTCGVVVTSIVTSILGVNYWLLAACFLADGYCSFAWVPFETTRWRRRCVLDAVEPAERGGANCPARRNRLMETQN